MIEEGDTVVGEWTYRATHTGPFVMADGTEIPATGKTVELPGVTVAEISGREVRGLRVTTSIPPP